MKLFKLIFLFFVFVVLLVGIINFYPKAQSFETRRANIIADINHAIIQQEEEGNYNCCIEPACTMCFMGDWIWNDGICRCDDMIARGEEEKVCPQCKKGLKNGECKDSPKID